MSEEEQPRMINATVVEVLSQELSTKQKAINQMGNDINSLRGALEQISRIVNYTGPVDGLVEAVRALVPEDESEESEE